MNGSICIAGGRVLSPQHPFGIMGIVNCTPDSFYQATNTPYARNAVCRALTLREEGADILDLGGESTRPLAPRVAEREERNRLLPVLLALSSQAKGSILSVDTWHAGTAAIALNLGVSIINDISGAQWDPALIDVLVQYKPGYVLTHAAKSAEEMHTIVPTKDIVYSICSFFESRLHRLTSAGLPENRIILDPGIGFGKSTEQTLAVLRSIPQFTRFARPLLVGISQKSFFGNLLGLPLQERENATQIATALLWEKGIFWHRVHHVAQTRQTLVLTSHLMHNQPFEKTAV